jgi:hypothetical protein
MAQPIDGVTLSIPEIQYLATGIENPLANSSMKVSPNPFKGITNVSFTMVNQGKVKLDLYDMTGMLISNLAETDLFAGNQQIELNLEGIRPGVYMLKAVLNSNGQEYTEIVKLVVSK